MRRPIAALFVLAALGLSAQSDEAGPWSSLAREARLEERAAARLVARRLWVAPRPRTAPGYCALLGVADLEVRLRGEPVPPERIVELQRADGPRLHGLVLDVSGSAGDQLDAIRSAAARYLDGLDPRRDRAFLLAFDDSPVLVRGAGADLGDVRRALRSLRAGGGTVLWDAVVRAAELMRDDPGRGVLLLLTDGMDTGSLRELDDALDALRPAGRPAVFAIGFAVPPIDAARPGPISPKKLLGRLARAGDGMLFDVPTGPELDDVFRRISEIVDDEATIVVADDRPDLPEGRLRVRSRDPACRVRVQSPAVVTPADVDPQAAAAPDVDVYRDLHPRVAVGVDENCAAAGPGLVADPTALSGCIVDLVFDRGPLYTWDDPGRTEWLDWPRIRRRFVHASLPPPEALPIDPVAWMDEIAAAAVEAAARPFESHPFKRPIRRHARPISDVPLMINGAALLDSRRAISAALVRRDDYRAWAVERERADAGEALADWRRRLRAHAPGLDAGRLDEIVAESEHGRRLLERAERPTDRDLAGRLGIWLGDVEAAELMRSWEARRIAAWIAQEGSPVDRSSSAGFAERWRALSALWWVPSYDRIQAPLLALRSPDDRRIGFRRVVLPRTAWMLDRVKGGGRHARDGGTPFDLVPRLPLGWLGLRAIAPAAGERELLRSAGGRVTGVRYVSLQPPRLRDPEHAFDHVRVDVEMDGGAVVLALEIEDRRRPGGHASAPVLIGVAFEGTTPRPPALDELVSELTFPLELSVPPRTRANEVKKRGRDPGGLALPGSRPTRGGR